jgi:hypothetical protein
MNSRTRYISSCLAVGILTVILMALLGFWSRWICTDTLSSLMPSRYWRTRVSPVGVLPEEIEQASDVVVHSEVAFGPERHNIQPWAMGLGAIDYFYGLHPEFGRTDVLVWQMETDGIWIYYDRKQGLIVCSKVEKPSAADPNSPRRAERIWLYAGPEGIAETPDKALGRFRSLVVTPGSLHLYDAEHRRFFTVDFWQRKVVKGPELDEAEGHEPVQIGEVGKHRDMFSWGIEPPGRRKDPNEPEVPADRFGHSVRRTYRNIDVVPTIPLMVAGSWASPYVFVLDASGRIDLLDKETLEFAGRAAVLPAVDEFFGRPRRPAQPRSLLAYDVQPVVRPTDDSHSKWPYLGCVAGAYNRDGTCATLATFDRQGSPVGGATRWTVEYEDVPGGPMVATIRFVLENLHPPALFLLSYFTAPYDEAGAGYRSLFVVPDSFVAKKGRDLGGAFGLRFIGALALMAPALVLAVFLAVLVGRSAQKIGFSKDARTLWILITVAFGLPAYITYRLTSAGTTLVTCVNCGLPRRPDMDRCHRCNSPWDVPELNPPVWRVLDGGRSEIAEPPMPAEEVATE